MCILEIFVDKGFPLNVKEICKNIDIPESTLYRYINTLVEGDYLEYDPSTQKYRLGINLIRIGHTAQKQLEIHRISYPIMEELARKSGETVVLTLRKGENAVIVEVVDSGRAGIKLAVNPGDNFPLHLCAITRPLIAFMSDEEIESILCASPPIAYTEHTVIDLDKIRRELKKVRHQGYAYSVHQLTEGARGLGAPVRDYSGRVIATIGLIGSVQNFHHSKIPNFVKMLFEVTEECSVRLGFKSFGQNKLYIETVPKKLGTK